MSHDPLDELIEDLERIVPPAQPASSDFAAALLDKQLAIARTLDAAGRQVRRGLHRFVGRDDEPKS